MSSNRSYLIKTNFQIRLFLKIIFIIFVSIAVSCVVFYFYADKEIVNSMGQFHITAENFLDYLLPAILTSGILWFIAAMIITIYLPHSYGGPLYRIERDLKKIGAGDLTIRFHLRKGDELKVLAESLNIMLENISSYVKKMKSVSVKYSQFVNEHESRHE